MKVMPIGDYKGQPLENLPSRYAYLLMSNNQFTDTALRIALLKVLTKRTKATLKAEIADPVVIPGRVPPGTFGQKHGTYPNGRYSKGTRQ